MQPASAVTTFLFTDIEGSTRLWEQEPERMPPALARHDAVARAAVTSHRGVVVKTMGDGIHAAFDDPRDAIGAALQLQQDLANGEAADGVTLRVRCGIHVGVGERRDNDFFGDVVNRAARIMSAAHGGQVLLSQAVADLTEGRLPAGVALRDLGSVRLRDLTNPEHIYQLLHPQVRATFPPLRSLEATPNNLPQSVTSFVGRQAELTEVKTLLARTRLLTLLGAGGIGKTRLSLQVAADVLDQYPDGVWLVELAPLTDPRLVSQAAASVLGVKEEAGHPVIEAMVKVIRDRQLLLILDNCEHLVQACAELAAQLLQAGAHLKVLASSREHLNVAGETTYSVPALAVPDPQQVTTLSALTAYEAVRLFNDRAVAAQPAFCLTQLNATAVASICHRVDGLPLAIELAAARVRNLPVEEIAARLANCFQLLTGGNRTAMPRQQTLRALIDWSYDLLTQPERVLLRRLAVFVRGWTLDAAEAVCVGSELDKAHVFEFLTHLGDKSLVAVDAGGMRYRLLETVRQYAHERLNESGDGDRARTRHLAYYLELADKARPELVGPDQAAWLARLDLERENLLAAHAWCDHAERGGALGLRLASSLKNYWLNRGSLALGYRMTLEALARVGAQERNLARCRGLANAGQLGYFMGRCAEARSYLEESLAIAREIDDKSRIALVLQPLGLACLGQGDLATARTYLEEALALARGLGNKRELVAAINAVAQLHRVEGALDTAEPLCEQVVALARELEDHESIAISLLNLAMVAIGRGAGDRARRMLLEVLAIAEKIGSKPAAQSVLDVSAGLAVLSEEWGRAARFYGAAEARAEYTAIQRDAADEAFLKPLTAEARSALGTDAFAVAASTGGALSYEDAMGEVRAWLERGT